MVAGATPETSQGIVIMKPEVEVLPVLALLPASARVPHHHRQLLATSGPEERE